MIERDWFGGAGEWLPLAAFWLLLVALIALEAMLPIHRQPKEGNGRLVANFGLGLVNGSLFAALPLSSVIAATWARDNGVGLLNGLAVPGVLAFVLTILARSLAAYGLHVLAHRLPLLWRMHRVHHADTAVDLSTGFRHHPFELLFVALCHGAIAVGLGLSVPALAAYEATAIGLTLWTHANLRLPAGAERAAALLFVTPAVHHVHHSARQIETDSNYGEVFTLWDRLFGTLRRLDEAALTAARLGLGPDHDQDAPSLVRQLASPFRRKREPAPDDEAEAARLA